ncbi:glycosyl hydrolase [Herbiconiux sp. CPCC 203407]|uniref:Glycosyl hydrolase n=1 Tax=Herbiconiux oxytropis TaxID=2970915 RepID=A0AA41XGS2_9MICO|nr:glycosyl hydrolase [Herbiconiux oxytropis]MCS5723259.1 glycosyl hydrolase [Herbiconiux oxytropis]MCS5727914.1 glycosyl hydrolase [Herbiconiux oxytropis]
MSEAPLLPASGAYLGVYYGDGSVSDTDAAIGRTPRLHLTYFGWEDPWATDDVLGEDLDRGQISLVNWEPFGVDFADIVAGEYDDMLAQRGREVARLKEPIFLDFAAEMNEEEGWGGHDPELYVAAYRHIHDIVSASDGGNVVWVWAPNNVDSEGAPAALEYYPGDEYVDWTGIDGYNWGTTEPGFDWQSVESVFADMYDDLHTLGKPIIIGETASSEDGGSKAEWIRSIAPTLRDRFPDIKALVWFDVEKERDWRIRSSPEALAAFRELAADPQFD